MSFQHFRFQLFGNLKFLCAQVLEGNDDGSARVLDGSTAVLGLGRSERKELHLKVSAVGGLGLRWVLPTLDL